MGTIIIIINSPGQYHWSYLFPKYLVSLDPLSPLASVHTSPWSLALGVSNETSDEVSSNTDWSSHNQIHEQTRVTTAALCTLWWIYLCSEGFRWDQLIEKRRAAGGGLMEWGSDCLVDRPDNCPAWFSLAAGKGGWVGASPAAVGFAVLLLSPCHDGTPCSTPAAAVTNWASAPCLSLLLSLWFHPLLSLVLVDFCQDHWDIREISHLGKVELSSCYSGEDLSPFSAFNCSLSYPISCSVRLDSQSLLQPTWFPSERVIPQNKQDNFSTKVLYTLTFFSGYSHQEQAAVKDKLIYTPAAGSQSM